MRDLKLKRVAWLLFLTLMLLIGLVSRHDVAKGSQELQQRQQSSDPVNAEHPFSIFIPVVLNEAAGLVTTEPGDQSGPPDPGEPNGPGEPSEPGGGEDPGDDPGPEDGAEPQEPVYQPTGFEIDGDTALDQPEAIDWESAAFPPAVHLADPHSKGARDTNVFKPNGKFDQPDGWKISQGKVGPPQTELTNVFTWLIYEGDLAPGKPSDSWLVMAMERSKTQGTFYLDFEYNQRPWDGLNGGLLRSPGDLSVGYAIHGNPDIVEEDIRLYIIQFYPGNQPSACSVSWDQGQKPSSIGPGTDPCPAFGDSGWFYRFLGTASELKASGLGEATMNDVPFPAAWPSFDSSGDARDEIGAFQFAEAAINLDALGIKLSCGTFSSVHAKGRSSIEPGSDLKDLAGPVPLSRDCRLEGHKFLDVNGDGQWDPAEPPLEDWTIRLAARDTTTTNEDGFYEFNNLQDGLYKVQEECPDGWVQTAPAATDFAGCGSASYEVEISIANSEVTGLDFGNGQPELSVNQSCPGDVFVGDDIVYTVNLMNSGNVDLRDVLLTVDGAGDVPPIDRMEPGQTETVEFAILAEEAGQVSMTAEASGIYGLATVLASSESSCDTVVHGLAIKKEAQTTFDRQYHWSINKEVDDPGPFVILRGRALFPTYTVTVGLDGTPYTDNNYQVRGTIIINNPAPMKATLSSVTDLMEPGIEIPVDCPAMEVPAHGSLTCTYGPQDVQDNSLRLNTATATLVNNNGNSQEFKDSTEVDFEDANIIPIDGTVEVDDSLVGPLGTVSYNEAPGTFVYQNNIGPYHDQCGQINVQNMATYTTDDTGQTGQAMAVVDIYVMCTVRIGFEDRPIQGANDWDYNDLVVDVGIDVELGDTPVYPNLEAVHLTIARLVGGPEFSAKQHAFYVTPNTFACDGSYVKRTFLDNGTVLEESGPYTRGDDFFIFSEREVLPDHVELSIFFDIPPEGCPCNKELLGDPLTTYHGEAVFFNPWMKALWEDEVLEFHPGDDELLAVPDVWQWPEERQHIWELYPKVIPGNPPTFVPYWWLL